MDTTLLLNSRDLKEILAAYHLGELLKVERLPQGTVQANYFLETSSGKAVLRYYQVRTRDQILFERDLILYLTRMGYPSPGLIPDSDGEYLGDYQGRPLAIFEFIEGKHLADPTLEQYQTLIQKAAQLQQLSNGFSSPYTTQRWNYSPELCLKLAQKAAEQGASRKAHQKLAWLDRQLAELDLPADLPTGICHGDFHFSNVLYQDGEFAALIDFDDANITYLTFDLVGLIEHRAWPHGTSLLDLEAAREVVEIYSAQRELSQEEKEHLYDVYQLSILFDCVWYFQRWEGDSFREKMKIEALQELGRGEFFDSLFGKHVKGY